MHAGFLNEEYFPELFKNVETLLYYIECVVCKQHNLNIGCEEIYLKPTSIYDDIC